MATQPRLWESNAPAAERDDVIGLEYREHLRQCLEEPAFRATEGFPIGDDEAILDLSDPPFFTACPNPFLEEFVRRHGKPYDPDEPYHREPRAVDVSEGKTDPLYRAHGYHTKVPHLAIVPSILHYTNPGDLVLDGFCGSGMTGVAAQYCGTAPEGYRRSLDAKFREEGRRAPTWGTRRAILNDLSPAATFIAANYNLPFDIDAFAAAARQLLDEVERELGWMYETRHSDGRTGRIDYTVWSQVFACPECGGDIVFLEAALDAETKRVRDEFPCPGCGIRLTKDSMQRVMETLVDAATGEPWERVRFIPVLINYRIGQAKYEKAPDPDDLEILEQIAHLPLPASIPTNRFPVEQMSHGSRIAPKGFTHVHHFFLPRAAQALGVLWRKADCYPDNRIRHMGLFFVEQAIWGMSILNRYSPSHFSQVNRALNGVYYIAAQTSEVSPFYILNGKFDRLVSAFRPFPTMPNQVIVSTGTCASLSIPDNCIDYVFTDPPFGENIYYADLNLLVESWYGTVTDPELEAIVDRAKHKGLMDYQKLMRCCFTEYCRVLKPGRWITVVFHNSSNSVWNAIQEALLSAGLVVAAVGTMDKQQGSYRQMTSTAVKKDLIISAYKPSEPFERQFVLEAGTENGVWSFIREHLKQLPCVREQAGVLEPIVERQPEVLFDQMVAFHVQRGVAVPLFNAAFRAALLQKFTPRHGMIFLEDQASEYDEACMRAERIGQLTLFVNDEKSSILWLRRLIDPAAGGTPQTYQEILPQFLRRLHQARHEQLPELGEILDQNFLRDGEGRWYVPDPNRAEDLERVRRNALLREFAGYLAGRGRLRAFRTEAVRAGFADAYRRGAYGEIVGLAERLPEAVLQEDPDLLMYYDNASLRAG